MKMLRPQEVAERLDVPAETVRGWCRSGKLTAIDVSRVAGTGKPRYRISPDSLAAFIEQVELSKPAQRSARKLVVKKRQFLSTDGEWLV
jgi:excisionase family DNA binding protein